VNDLLPIAKKEADIEFVKSFLSKEVTLKDMGVVKRFCGVDVEKKNNCYLLSQVPIIDALIAEYGLDDCKDSVKSPLYEFKDFSTEETVNLPVRNLIGSLQYIASRTRPDITASLNYLSRFMQNPTVEL